MHVGQRHSLSAAAAASCEARRPVQAGRRWKLIWQDLQRSALARSLTCAGRARSSALRAAVAGEETGQSIAGVVPVQARGIQDGQAVLLVQETIRCAAATHHEDLVSTEGGGVSTAGQERNPALLTGDPGGHARLSFQEPRVIHHD